ncbi:hypothetical protein L3Q65_08530 [Amycolatopsis sp. FU40]|uniref:hypothetical protein n=1 Tax=Amycolatopsis sp. FU40 TaxID=2914159 RepID=UPI001F188836|nr:hypothetical protein [Amycolatopsis sp. FU40]UKD59627.1 hypothetical protein L3Q65_08530 [Amycolatopsis sp. FU40]
MVLAALALGLFGLTPSASATTGDLGGMMLAEYCQAMHFDGAVDSRNGQSNPWFCYRNNPRTLVPLDLFGACHWQFFDLAGAGFKVTCLGPGGRCWALNATDYSSPSDLSALPGYCRSLGYRDVHLAYRNVAGWRCVGYDNVVHPLDLHAACRWANSGLVARGYSLVSYFNHYGDTFKIRCLSMKHT